MNDTSNHCLVLTGAGGTLGRVLRAHFTRQGRSVLVTDIRNCGPLAANETSEQGDLADEAFTDRLLQRASAVVHLAGVPSNRPLCELIGPNFLAVGHLYRQARRHGVRRVVFASSNHVSGMSAVGELIDAASPLQPDSHYGASKAWGEAVARMYWDKYGIASLCLRIGSCLPAPTSPRHLSTWLSHADLCRLVDGGLDDESSGFRIAYGVSANALRWWPLAGGTLDRAEDHFVPTDRTGGVHVDPIDALRQGGGYAHLADGE